MRADEPDGIVDLARHLPANGRAIVRQLKKRRMCLDRERPLGTLGLVLGRLTEHRRHGIALGHVALRGVAPCAYVALVLWEGLVDLKRPRKKRLGRRVPVNGAGRDAVKRLHVHPSVWVDEAVAPRDL